jgi:hypothetical protein
MAHAARAALQTMYVLRTKRLVIYAPGRKASENNLSGTRFGHVLALYNAGRGKCGFYYIF